MHILHEYPPSGNCYKVRLLASHLGLPLQRVAYDLRKGEGRTPEFRAKFPLGRLPVLELPDGTQLAESNAILCFLGHGTDSLSDNRIERAQTLQWLFWEQYSHEPYVAVARAWISFFGIPRGKEQELVERKQKAMGALHTMELHLQRHAWFSGDRYGVADISLYAYTHVADEGQIPLDSFVQVRRWLDRFEANQVTWASTTKPAGEGDGAPRAFDRTSRPAPV